MNLHLAAKLGSLTELEKVVQKERENGYPDKSTLQRGDPVLGATPLHFAAEFKHLEIVQYLIDKGVSSAGAIRTDDVTGGREPR